MSWQAVAAIAGSLAVILPIIGGIIALAYNAGQHAQRLAAHHDAIEKLKTTTEEHSRAISAWDQALKLLEEVRADVKGLLIGKVPQGRRHEP